MPDPILCPSESPPQTSTTIFAPPELSKSGLLKQEEKKEDKKTEASPDGRDKRLVSRAERNLTSPLSSSSQQLVEQHFVQSHIGPSVYLSNRDELTQTIAAAETFVGGGIDFAVAHESQAQERILVQQQSEASLLSSLTLLVNRSFSFGGETLKGFLQGIPFDKSALGSTKSNRVLSSQFLSNLSSDFAIQLLNLSESKLAGELVSNASLFALSVGLLGAAQLNPAQLFSLAFIYSLGLSPQETGELLKYFNRSIDRSLLHPSIIEQARFLAPLLQGVILNDPAAMKGFLAQLFSPALKVLMSLFLMKELNFNFYPSSLLAELGSLMARSAQRRRQRYRTRVGKSTRVSRKDPSLFAGVDPQDEGYEPEDEIEWWDQLYSLYPHRETNSFLWN